MFFPSYTAMDGMVQRWLATGLYEAMKALCGEIIVEPKGSQSLRKAGGEALASIAKPQAAKGFMSSNVLKSAPSTATDGGELRGDEADDCMKGLVSQFDSAIAKNGSCLLFAVCRFDPLFIDLSTVSTSIPFCSVT